MYHISLESGPKISLAFCQHVLGPHFGGHISLKFLEQL